MRWTFGVAIKSELHAEMRIFQVVDCQQAVVLAFSGRRHGDELRIMLDVETDEPRARRIESLLRNLQAVLCVEASSGEGSARE